MNRCYFYDSMGLFGGCQNVLHRNICTMQVHERESIEIHLSYVTSSGGHDFVMSCDKLEFSIKLFLL